MSLIPLVLSISFDPAKVLDCIIAFPVLPSDKTLLLNVQFPKLGAPLNTEYGIVPFTASTSNVLSSANTLPDISPTNVPVKTLLALSKTLVLSSAKISPCMSCLVLTVALIMPGKFKLPFASTLSLLPLMLTQSLA